MKELDILYIVDYCPKFNSGIGQKLRAQLKYLNRSSSTKMLLLAITEYEREWDHLDNIHVQKISVSPWLSKTAIFRKYRLMRQVHKALLDLNDLSLYDRIYFRYKRCTPELVKFGKKQDNIVFEINGHLFHEIRSAKRNVKSVSDVFHNLEYHYLKKYTEFYLASKLMNSQRAISYVSYELSNIARLEWKLEDKVKSIVLGNGIETNVMLPRNYSGFTPGKLKVLLLKGAASDAPHLGLDRVLSGLSKINELQFDLEFHFCGKYFNDFKSQAMSLGVEDLFHFHGFVEGEDMVELLNQCDIALGTLSPRLNEISSLKAREYFARGIPFVYGYKDTDIDAGSEAAEYCLSISNDGSPIDFEYVYKKLFPILKDREHPVKMNNLAKELFSMETKMRLLTSI